VCELCQGISVCGRVMRLHTPPSSGARRLVRPFSGEREERNPRGRSRTRTVNARIEGQGHPVGDGQGARRQGDRPTEEVRDHRQDPRHDRSQLGAGTVRRVHLRQRPAGAEPVVGRRFAHGDGDHRPCFDDGGLGRSSLRCRCGRGRARSRRRTTGRLGDRTRQERWIRRVGRHRYRPVATRRRQPDQRTARPQPR
jgi:hypothetical protein